MSSKNINFHFGPKDDVVKHDAFINSGYKQVFENLHENGYGVTVTRGTAHLNFETGTVDEVWIPQPGETFRTRRDVGERAIYSAFQATRDLARLLQPTPEHPLPMLNAASVIEYDRSKSKAHSEVLANLSAPTVALDADALDALDTLIGDRIFVKPDFGSGGAGIQTITRAEARDVLSSRSNERLIAQELITMASELPGLKPFSPEDAEKMRTLQDRNKELRVFVFRSNEGIETMGVARYMKSEGEKADTWVHIEQSSISDEVIASSKAAFDTLADKAGVSEVYGAADFMYGSVPSSPDDRWLIGELNLWRPVLARKNNRELARVYDKAMASQLIRLAENKPATTEKRGQ